MPKCGEKIILVCNVYNTNDQMDTTEFYFVLLNTPNTGNHNYNEQTIPYIIRTVP